MLKKVYKPKVKMGGLLCNHCNRVICQPHNEDEAQGRSGPVLCYKCLTELVNNYKTKDEKGFTNLEEQELLLRFPTINKDKYFDALRGITGQVIDGDFITYHCDILTALKCGLENRNPTAYEWD